MSANDIFPVTKHRLDLERFVTMRAIDRHVAKNSYMETLEYLDSDLIMVRAIADLFVEEVHDDSATLTVWYPATWWEHLKHRFFSVKMLKRWPVNYHKVEKTVTFKVKALYEDLDLMPDRPVRFLHEMKLPTIGPFNG